MTDKRQSSLILLLILGIIWGSGYIIAKCATELGVSPLGYAFWQTLGPAIVTLIAVFILRLPIKLDWPHVRYYVCCGLLGIAIPNTNMYFAAPHVPAGMMALMVNTVPIFTYALALIVHLEKFSWQRFVGILCGFAGIVCVIEPQFVLPHSSSLPWLLQLLISPVAFALCAVYVNRSPLQDVNPLVASAGMLLSSAILLLPLVLYKHAFYNILHIDPASELVAVEIVLSSLGYILFFKLIQRAGAVFYSLVGCVVVLTGLFWGWVIYHEMLSALSWLAVALILLAVSLVNFRGKTAEEAV